MIVQKAGLGPEDRPVIAEARKREEETAAPALAIELADGRIVTGKTTNLLGPSAALILNALKVLGGIEKKDQLISPTVIEPIQTLKCDYLGNRNPRLHSDEVLVALSICAATDPKAALAMRPASVAGGTGGAFHGHFAAGGRRHLPKAEGQPYLRSQVSKP